MDRYTQYGFVSIPMLMHGMAYLRALWTMAKCCNEGGAIALGFVVNPPRIPWVSVLYTGLLSW